MSEAANLLFKVLLLLGGLGPACPAGRLAGLERLLSGEAARLPAPPKMWPSKSELRIPLKIPVCGPAKLLGREESTSQGAKFGTAPRRGQLRYLLGVSCVL